MKTISIITILILSLFHPNDDEKKVPSLQVQQWYNSEGEPVDLESLKGKAVLLDFWGVWCGPCVENIPKLKSLREKFSCDELEIITIHTPIASKGLPKFIEERNFCLTVGVDKRDPNDKHTYYGLTTKSFGIIQFPSYVLIDSKGDVAGKFEEIIPTYEEIAKKIGK